MLAKLFTNIYSHSLIPIIASFLFTYFKIERPSEYYISLYFMFSSRIIIFGVSKVY